MRRRRRLLAALLLCAAAALAVHQLTPASPAVVTAVLASRDLPAGHLLGSTDLITAAVSPKMLPDGALTPASTHLSQAARPTAGGSRRGNGSVAAVSAWEGQQLSGPVRRGEVLTDASLLGNGLLVGSPTGSQAVPLRLSDPSTLALLRQGQLVTVVLSSSDSFDGPVSNELLAEKVAVLWTPVQDKWWFTAEPRQRGGRGGGSFGGTSRAAGWRHQSRKSIPDTTELVLLSQNSPGC